jgi:hypothetical protein
VTGGKTIIKTFQNKKRDKKHRTRIKEAEAEAERETLWKGGILLPSGERLSK